MPVEIILEVVDRAREQMPAEIKHIVIHQSLVDEAVISRGNDLRV
jgi:hypothetical protein